VKEAVTGPVLFAVRRLRERPGQTALLVLALGAAGAIVGASSIVGALAHERSVRDRIAAAPTPARAVSVQYRSAPAGDATGVAAAVGRMFSGFSNVMTRPVRVQVWDPVAPADQRGIRLVVANDRSLVVIAGRSPRGCEEATCEAVALSGELRLGQVLPLAGDVRLRIVGSGFLSDTALPDQGLLAGRAVLVAGVAGTPMELVASDARSSVSETALLAPGRVAASQLGELAGRLRAAAVRLEREESSITVSAPVPLLDELASLGATSRNRLLIVSSGAAALLLSFAAFAATLRRRDLDRMRLQLVTLGGSRRQLTLVRAAEVALPAAVALILVLAGLRLALVPIQAAHDLGEDFVGEALPLPTLLAVGGLELIGALILFAAVAPRPRRRFGVGALEVAALTALAVVVWQALATGGLDPNQVASGSGGLPVLLLTPALAVFAAATLFLRLLPLLFRLAERAARGAPSALRLGLLATARSPAQAAATTTFLAVALGSALFSLNYRATLDRQAKDAAAFTVGAEARAAERGVGTGAVTTLLERQQASVPALRLGGVAEGQAVTEQRTLTILALPASTIAAVAGWRDEFSAFSPGEIARRLRHQPISLSGPVLSGNATAVRVWARTNAPAERLIVLHLLTRGGGFTTISLGRVGDRWQLLEAEVPAEFRETRLIGIEFPLSVGSSGDVIVQPGGVTGNVTDSDEFVDFSQLAFEDDGEWQQLAPLSNWVAAQSPDFRGTLTRHSFTDGPVAEGQRFHLGGTAVPLVRPPIRFQTADGDPSRYLLPALVGPTTAASAVDQQLTVAVAGRQLRLTVVAQATLFPTITSAPGAFAVVDYQTLFAALNADQPGLTSPNEAWFARPPAADMRAGPVEVVRLAEERQRLLNDPLAAGTRQLLTSSGYAAAVLALIGLVLAVRIALANERQLLAEYQALGVAPRTLGRSVEVRLLFLALLGVAAAAAGAALAIRVVATLVAVTGTAGLPLPPIATTIAWQSGGVLLAAVALAAIVSAVLLSGRSLREPAARRLRR
jgi:hypothetical protein